MKNLFDFANKELSQDAFLRWLFENYNCENEKVRKTCERVFNKFTYEPSFGSISSFNNHCFESTLNFSTHLLNGSSIVVTTFSSIPDGCFQTLGTSVFEHSHIWHAVSLHIISW